MSKYLIQSFVIALIQNNEEDTFTVQDVARLLEYRGVTHSQVQEAVGDILEN